MNPIRIVDVQHADNIYALSYPFLNCPQTISFLRRTKVMFVMRGLPGSGKSTLVKILEQIYSKSLVVCSADHFFLDENGIYKFEASRLSDAHRTCQKKTEEACQNNVGAVIIDNTNIRHDECRFYFQTASKFGYVVLLVEPRTSWKRDPVILAEKNSHHVPKEVIEARLKQYHPIIPSYFAVFLNEEESTDILNISQEFYRRALKNLPNFRKDLEKISRNQKIPVEFLLSRKNMNNSSTILHCTMKFFGKITDETRKEYENYAANRIVSHSVGKLCSGHVVAFGITSRTLTARLSFSDRHVSPLWAQNDNEPFSIGKNATKKVQTRSNRKKKGAASITTDDHLEETEEFESLTSEVTVDEDDLAKKMSEISMEPEETSFFHPTFGFLSRAHLTCAVGPGISSAQAGIDLVQLIRQETLILKNKIEVETFEDELCAIRDFSDGQSIVYLKQPIPFSSIFSGSFL